MPFKSQAQRALFYSKPELNKYIPEWEHATKGKLPERVGKPKPTRKQILKQSIKTAHKRNK